MNASAKTSAQQISSLTREPKREAQVQSRRACFWGAERLVRFTAAASSHLVKLPQVLLLRLIDYSQDSGDGFADDTAAMKTKNEKSNCVLCIRDFGLQ